MKSVRLLLATAGASVVLFISSGVLAQQVLFDMWVTYHMSQKPACVVSADLDDDQDQDLVISHGQIDHTGKNPIVIMKNDGTGLFVRDTVLYARGNPIQAAVFDLDLDGDMDILTANSATDRLSIFKNRGGGRGYDLPLDCPVGNQPLSILAGRVDADATPDLVTTNSVSGTLSLLFNHGSATFPAESTKNLGIDPRCVVAVDIDNDGDKDLAASLWALKLTVPSRSGQDLNRIGGINGVVVMENFGNGRFDDSTRVFYKIPASDTAKVDTLYNPNQLLAADFNEDGYPDLALADSATGVFSTRAMVCIYLNNGDKTFARPDTFRVGLGCRSIFAADLDRDGHIDIAAANAIDGTISFLKGNGDGTFAPRKDYLAPVKPYWVDGGDFDRDGDIDLVVAGWEGAALAILRNRGDGKYEVGTEYSTGRGQGSLPSPVLAIDLDNDGDLDLAIANPTTNQITIHRNDSIGAFPQPPSLPDSSLIATNSPRGLASADFNGDGFQDLAAANQASSKVSVFLNRGRGKFASAASSQYSLAPNGSFPYAIAARDLDGDGAVDLAAACNSSRNIAIFRNNNDGTGTFLLTAFIPTGRLPYFIASADFNADGHFDLATLDHITSGGTDSVSIFINDGVGGFPIRATYPVGSIPTSLAAADLDADGDLDLAVTNIGLTGGDTTIVVYRGNGDGTFSFSGRYYAAKGPTAINAADANGDGKLDLLCVDASVNALSFLAGNGDGTFAAPVEYGAGINPQGLKAADLDNDGDFDLAITDQRMVASPDSGSFTVLRNFSVPTCFARGDLNGDRVFSAVDVTLEGNCIFRDLGTCPVCVADLNCDGRVSPTDIVFLLQKVFNGVPLPC